MFESVTNFFGNVKTFFQNGANTISGYAHTIYDKITDTGVSVVKTIHTDIKDVASGIKSVVTHTTDTTKNVIEHVVDAGKNVIVHGQDKISDSVNSLGSSLSFPLVIGAGLFGFLYLNKQ